MDKLFSDIPNTWLILIIFIIGYVSKLIVGAVWDTFIKPKFNQQGDQQMVHQQITPNMQTDTANQKADTGVLELIYQIMQGLQTDMSGIKTDMSGIKTDVAVVCEKIENSNEDLSEYKTKQEKQGVIIGELQTAVGVLSSRKNGVAG